MFIFKLQYILYLFIFILALAVVQCIEGYNRFSYILPTDSDPTQYQQSLV